MMNASRCFMGRPATTASIRARASRAAASLSGQAESTSGRSRAAAAWARSRRFCARKWFRDRLVAIEKSQARTLESGGSEPWARNARKNVSCERSSASLGRAVIRSRYRRISAWCAATTVSKASSAITLSIQHRGQANVKWGPDTQRGSASPLGGATSGRGEPLLQVPGVAGHGIGADPVDHGDEEIELEGPDLAVIDHLGGLGQIHEADDGGERGVLEEHDELGDEGRDHVLQRLRQHHLTHGLRAAEPHGRGRLDLAARHRLYARTHDLAQVSGLEDDEGRERYPELQDGSIENHRDDDPDPEDHHD